MNGLFKRILAVSLAAVVVLGAAPIANFTGITISDSASALIYSESCGDNLSWSFNDETGVLEISGNGEMKNFSVSELPWHSLKSEIISVKVSEGVTSICDYAFYSYPNIETVSISSSVAKIGINALSQCLNLNSIYVNPDNQYYSSDDFGVLFDKYQETLIQYPIHNTRTSYEIPESVRIIADSSFRYCESLLNITLPQGLTVIGEEAFYSSGITSVSIPSSVTDIGKNAFGWCFNLTSFSVDSANGSYSSDGYGVLFSKDKTELIKYPDGSKQTSYSIPESVTSITADAFENCYRLQSVTIPESVINIGSGVFFNCNLKSISVDKSNKNYSSDDNGALFDKEKTELIQYPIRNEKTGYNVPESVTTIKESAFHNNQIIENIVLPDGITTIENNAFMLCSNLKYIHIPASVTEIGKNIISNENTYICSESDNCFAKEYAETNGYAFNLCGNHNVTGISLSETEIQITNKHTYQLTATVTPDSAADKSVEWNSDNEAVATVDENGVVTAVSVGTTEITATTEDGGFSASCMVTVSPREFNVIWNVDGIETTQSVAEGETITEPDTPEKTGYTFKGWTPSIPDTMPAENLTFRAVWDTNSYNAVFDANGGFWNDGSTEKVYSVEYNTDIYPPRTPERPGYGFTGWSPELGVMDSVDGKEFRATWSALTNIKYTVETYIMGTNGEYTKTTKDFEGTTDTTVNAEYEIENGFKLNTESSVLSGTVAADGSLVLKVYLDRISYVVSINGETFECLYGTEISEPERPSAPEGYYQQGWTDENGNKIEFPIVVNENSPSKIKPDFAKQSYTVKWIVDGVATTETYKFEDAIIIPSSPEKTGYTFEGWTPNIPDCVPANNLEFTAVWTPNIYEAVFDANGGVWENGDTEKAVAAAFDSKITAPEAPAKKGYIFTGWSPEVGIMNDINGKKYTANWIASTETLYTVEIYTMEPDGTYSQVVQILNGATDSAVTAEYTVETGFVFNAEKSVVSGVIKADNSLVLTAYIDRKSYTLTTVVDGISTSTDYLFGATIAELAEPVKEEYDFVGWDKEIPSTMPAENLTFTAKFEKTVYKCDCGEEFNDKASYNEHIAYEQAKKNIRISIKNNPGTATIKYGETLKLTAVTSAALPAGTEIYWYVDGVKAEKGETFNFSAESGTKTVSVKIVESNGKVLRDANGNEISDSQQVKVDSSFWQKIVSFFKNLFGINRTVVQAFFKSIV